MLKMIPLSLMHFHSLLVFKGGNDLVSLEIYMPSHAQGFPTLKSESSKYDDIDRSGE